MPCLSLSVIGQSSHGLMLQLVGSLNLFLSQELAVTLVVFPGAGQGSSDYVPDALLQKLIRHASWGRPGRPYLFLVILIGGDELLRCGIVECQFIGDVTCLLPQASSSRPMRCFLLGLSCACTAVLQTAIMMAQSAKGNTLFIVLRQYCQ